MIAGASALICVGLLSAALLLMEEEEQENRLLAVASTVVPEILLSLRKRRSGRHENFRRVKRRLVFWNREREPLLAFWKTPLGLCLHSL